MPRGKVGRWDQRVSPNGPSLDSGSHDQESVNLRIEVLSGRVLPLTMGYVPHRRHGPRHDLQNEHNGLN